MPERYLSWSVLLATAEGEVFAQRLGGGARLLFRADGILDADVELVPVGRLTAVVYERLRDHALDLCSFSTETGRSTVLAEDIDDFASVVDGRTAAFIEAGEDGSHAVWAVDVLTGERSVVRSRGVALRASSEDASGPALFATARSDPGAEPIDQDLCVLKAGRLEAVESAPHGSTFSAAHVVADGLLYAIVRQGGETHGEVVLRSSAGGRSVLARHAEILSAGPRGPVLLGEPLGEDGAVTSEGSRTGSRLLLHEGAGEPRQVGPVYTGLRHACLAGARQAVVSYTKAGAQGLDVIDLHSGDVTAVPLDARWSVSRIEPVDGGGALIVMDELGADGLAVRSRLVFLPLDRMPRPIVLFETDSGYISISRPFRSSP